MAMTVHVDVVSPESILYSGLAEMVVAPTKMGEVGITPRHAPLLAIMKPGDVKIKKPGGVVEHYYVSGGVLEVLPHLVTILSDTCIRAHDLNEAKALEAKRNAERIIERKNTSQQIAIAEIKLMEAVAQLRIIEKTRKR